MSYRSVRLGFVTDQQVDSQVHDQDEQDKNKGGLPGSTHAAGIVDTVEKHRGQVAQEQVHPAPEAAAPVGTALGPAVKDSHEDREAHMPRHRQNGTGQGDGEPVIEHILHILEGGEAQGDKDRVDNGVKAEIEVGIAPGPPVQEEELGALFHSTHHKKGKQYHISGIVRIHQGVEDRFPQKLQNNGRQRRQHALPYKASQQPHRLPFDPVLPVNITHEKNSGHHRGQNVDRCQIKNRGSKQRSKKEHGRITSLNGVLVIRLYFSKSGKKMQLPMAVNVENT